ncbi:Rho GTPase, putative [Entamoeba invadens IP1]|uniref:small monomeric GTPase n=1 Tax=Entamoeba invadens IP1 TaxID=370355 RepID=A0A0A1UAY9_ENTIV|nr:Rho GTPase, putative [Entamoeba invadens IP1]ELP89339.1 Rho GTPase, putative [Entamoeba invadens IP1]|eukprot:XP_004256110.1 Rho GTPase, putative [Entamoeba invadens IP1]
MINQKIKLLFIGENSVGKTSLITKYRTGEFHCEYIPIITEIYTVTVTYNDIQFNMEIWDKGGQEEYRLIPSSYPNTTCFVPCFSIVNLDTFKSLKTLWLPEIKRLNRDIPILLVGLKSDLRESNEKEERKYPISIHQKITTEEGLQMAKDIGACGYVECSSMNDSNVNSVFEKAIQISYEYLQTQMNTK